MGLAKKLREKIKKASPGDEIPQSPMEPKYGTSAVPLEEVDSEVASIMGCLVETDREGAAKLLNEPGVPVGAYLIRPTDSECKL